MIPVVTLFVKGAGTVDVDGGAQVCDADIVELLLWRHRDVSSRALLLQLTSSVKQLQSAPTAPRLL